MVSCRFCSTENSDSGRFCSECGAALKDEYAPTEIPVSGDSSSLLSSSSDSHHGRFLPGTKIADRYRIVSLVGKGGMGEVYRADDLKLGHTVALKFLPKELADDPQRMEYFHTEVRLTRQISHPNVCRVYDIGEADGQLFLSMEYIDGEDLRVLLRRIGKLPQDKGIQIAQQLCAGLAAAHDRGVLHRDLKPANIMLDGRGQVRITDFGLAKLADEGTEGEIAGTPAYMAPEQLAGGQVTIQSDLYSLGLIFYELFTGDAVRKPGSIPELIRANQESSLSHILEFPSDIDPVVQRAISWCLEREPHERPISAKAVAASLPGGDPLAAALAAGETPSPELVAAAGESGLLSVRRASIYFAIVVVGLILLVPFMGAVSPTHGLEDSAEVFAGKARAIFRELGHESANDASQFEKYQFDWVKNEKTTRIEILEFWYRRSPERLFQQENIHDMFNSRSEVTLINPQPLAPGMKSIVLNADQKLRQLHVVPDPQRQISQRLIDILHEGEKEDAKYRFEHELVKIVEPFFEWAALPLADDKIDGQLSEQLRYTVDVSPRNRAPFSVDDYFVFRPKPESGLKEIRQIELALADQKVVYFNVEKPSSPSKKKNSTSEKETSSKLENGTKNLGWTFTLLILPVTMFMAWRNTLLGRSDRRAAWRVAVFLFFVTLLGTRLMYGLTLDMFRASMQLSAGVAFQTWIYYLALEPIVRKFWPGILTAWSRAMTGRWRDPSLGHSLLIGAMMGTCVPFLYGQFEGLSRELSASVLSGNVEIVAEISRVLRLLAGWGLYMTITLVLCRVVVRRNWIAGLLAGLLLSFFWFFNDVVNPNGFTIILSVYFLTMMFFLIRFGVVAAFSFLFCHHLLLRIPFTDDLKGPDLAPTIFAVGVVLAIAGYGFYASVGGRTYFASLFSADSRHSSTS